MKILQINDDKNLVRQKAVFKSCAPVYHFLREKGKDIAYPVCSKSLNETLQGKLVRILNNSVKFSDTEKGKRLIDIVSAMDKDYRCSDEKQKTRTYYNYGGGWIGGKFEPFNYLITGDDVKEFNEKFGKPIGKSGADSPKIDGRPISAEYHTNINNFVLGGLNFVKDLRRAIVSKPKKVLGLFTEFVVLRNSKGKIIDYELSNLEYRSLNEGLNTFMKFGNYSK